MTTSAPVPSGLTKSPDVIGGDQLLPPWSSPLLNPPNCNEIFAAWRQNEEDARLSLQALAEQLAARTRTQEPVLDLQMHFP